MNPRILELRNLIAAAVERMTAIDTEHSTAVLPDDARTEWQALEADVDAMTAELDELEARAARIDAARARGAITGAPAADTAPNMNTRQGERTTPHERIAEVRTFGPGAVRELRDLALEALEGDEYFADEHRTELERKLRRLDHGGALATRTLLLGHPDYRSAWAKMITGQAAMVLPEEARALQRAMVVGTNASGGFAVPTHLDPTIVLTNDGSTNPIRQRANVETLIDGNTWNGVSSAGVTAAFGAERAQVADGTPTLAQPSIDVEKAHAFVPASIEAAQDIDSLGETLLMLFQEARDDLEATKFAVGAGSGSNEPLGLIQAFVNDGTSTITSAATDTFAVADVYSTLEGTGRKYRGQGSWLAELAIINDIRQFGSALGHAFLTDLAGDTPELLLGKPLDECSGMDGSITASAHNYVLWFGDIRRAYKIVDKIGLTVEYIPHLFNTADNRPDGTRGWYAYWRTGGGLLNVNAGTLLNVT